MNGVSEEVTFYIGSNDRARMQKLLSQSGQVVTFIDGACAGNPGLGGCGVAFFARKVERHVSIAASDSEAEDRPEEKLEFLFGCRIHLGMTTSNYAEYCGLILAQIVHAMAGTRELTVKTDSQLLANQVKGNMRVKNVRITRLMPIVHDLALHF